MHSNQTKHALWPMRIMHDKQEYFNNYDLTEYRRRKCDGWQYRKSVHLKYIFSHQQHVSLMPFKCIGAVVAINKIFRSN